MDQLGETAMNAYRLRLLREVAQNYSSENEAKGMQQIPPSRENASLNLAAVLKARNGIHVVSTSKGNPAIQKHGIAVFAKMERNKRLSSD